MEIYFVRHTTPAVEKGICYGQADLDVTDTFESELEVIKRVLPGNISTFTIFSSPLIRCRKLAEGLAERGKIHFDDRLKEMDFGDWELMAWDAIDKRELDPWMKDFVNQPSLNGESYQMLYKRVLAFYNECVNQNLDRVIVVTHSGVIRAIRAFFENAPLSTTFSYQMDYGIVYGLCTLK